MTATDVTLSEFNPDAADPCGDTLFAEAIIPFDDIAASFALSASGFLMPRRGFTPFNVGEVWYSPKRTLYRVVGHQRLQGQVTHAVLLSIAGASGRQIRRGIAATRNWRRVHSYVFKKERGNPDKFHLAESTARTALCDMAVRWKSFGVGYRDLCGPAVGHFCSICAHKGEPTLALAAVESAHFKK